VPLLEHYLVLEKTEKKAETSGNKAKKEPAKVK
jgi:hypothetical protein